MDLDKLIRAIEANGGPENLDLTGVDMSGCDLSREAVIRKVEELEHKGRPIWQSHVNGGLNLSGAILKSARFFSTNMAFVDLSFADLEEAFLQAANLSNARLRNTNFYNAELNQCDLSGITAPNASFDNADIGNSILSGANFDEASVKGASFYRAKFSGTQLSRREIGERIVQEDRETFEDFLLEHHASLGKEGVQSWLDRRHYEDARQVYASLKVNFLEIGNFDDASWAHIKERQMAKMTHHPKYAHRYYSYQLQNNSGEFSMARWSFYISHTGKWILDWLAELTVGYGERPLRTIVWSSFILFVFPFVYMLSGGIESTKAHLTLLDYFNYSFGAFTTMGFSQFNAVTPLSQTLTSIEALLGISFLALLMFALGNRISRS